MENFESKEIAVLCAWCGKKKGGEEWVEITPEEKTQLEKGLNVSHGICPKCAEKMEKE